MPHKIAPLRVEPLDTHLRKSSQIGAEVILPTSMKLLDPQALTEDDIHLLRDSLCDHSVLVIRNQLGVDPKVLYDIAKLFDPQAEHVHSGGEKQITDPKNILSQNNCSRVPRAPQVTVIGQGRIEGHEGIPLLQLKHLDHTTFHENPLSDDQIEQGYTRPYRWHMDAPLYESLPGFVTSLHAIEVPQVPDQQIQFPDGQSMPVAAGATLFFSGARNFELLSPEEQEFARNTRIQYAPRAYEWIRDCKASADGLTIETPGREKKLDELPEWDWRKVQSFPMVWENYGNKKPHLQILGCCVYSLTTIDPATGESSVISDIREVRWICHKFQSKVYTPENIFAHRWEQGDLVIFHNRGLLHSISGQLSKYSERRLMWQCSMASRAPPKAYSINEA